MTPTLVKLGKYTRGFRCMTCSHVQGNLNFGTCEKCGEVVATYPCRKAYYKVPLTFWQGVKNYFVFHKIMYRWKAKRHPQGTVKVKELKSLPGSKVNVKLK